MSRNNSASYRFMLNNASDGKRTATITLFGSVGGWSVNTQYLRWDLEDAGNVDEIIVLLNTAGGSFFAGLPIYNLLKQHKAFVTVRVMGFALSMGSHIMLAADKVEIARNGLVMIHNAQGWARGTANDLRREANIMEKHEQALMPAYVERLGKTETEIQAMLDEETWFTAKEALAAGLVDSIFDEPAKPLPEENDLDELLNSYKHTPKEEVQVQQGNFLTRLFSHSSSSSLVGANAQPPTTRKPETNKNKVTNMEPEQLTEIITAATKAGVKAGLAHADTNNNKKEQQTDPLKAVQDENEQLKERLAALEKEKAELEKPANENNPHIPENMGKKASKHEY